MIDKIKKRPYLALTGLIMICLGIYFLCAPADVIKNIVFVVIGLLLIALSIYKLYLIKFNLSNENAMMSIIIIVIGVILILFSSLVNWVFIICGIYILVEPVLKLLKSKQVKEQFMLELPKIILGIILILLAFDGIYGILFSAIGICLLIYGVYIAFCIAKDQDLIIIINKQALMNNLKYKQTRREKDDDDIIDVE
ncbi:MAG: hypothetical protein R3Y60_03665 [bacterium]